MSASIVYDGMTRRQAKLARREHERKRNPMSETLANVCADILRIPSWGAPREMVLEFRRDLHWARSLVARHALRDVSQHPNRHERRREKALARRKGVSA